MYDKEDNMSHWGGCLDLRCKIVKTETMKEDIFELLGFDNDENGVNGDEYLTEEAKIAGFTNNLEFWITESMKRRGNEGYVEKIIYDVIMKYDANEWKINHNVIVIDENTSYCAIAISY